MKPHVSHIVIECRDVSSSDFQLLSGIHKEPIIKERGVVRVSCIDNSPKTQEEINDEF